MNLKQINKMEITTERLASESKKGKIKLPLMEKTISKLKRSKESSELGYLGRYASEEFAIKAVIALGKLKDLEQLENIGEYRSEKVAKQAVTELSKLKAKEELQTIGKNASFEIAIHAVSALENLKAVPELTYLGMYACLKIRKEAVYSLRCIKAINELKSLGEHESPSVGKLIFEKSPEEKTSDEEVRKQAVFELQYLGGDRGTPGVENQTVPEFTKQAVSALEELGEIASLTHLGTYAHFSEVRKQAIAALENLKTLK